MSSIKGPAIALAQFVREEPPYNTMESLAEWASSLGYVAVQIPLWDRRCIDLDLAAASQAYCEDYQALLLKYGLEVSEVSAFLQGQVLAIHPAYEELFQAFYPEGLGDADRVHWASTELKKAVQASSNFGKNVVPVLSGGLAWPFMYPWPQRPKGLVEQAFDELARRWRPVLDFASEKNVAIAFELHPGSDLYDGSTFERFLDVTGHHPAIAINYDASHFVLQQLDYLNFIQRYGALIKGFHVKDAEFNPSGRVGVYGGYEDWAGRAGRFRSLGDGQIDYRRVFTLLTEAGYRGWAVLEWECCIKSPEQGAREGARFIRDHIIDVTTVAFDDFAGRKSDDLRNRQILGLTR